MYKLYYKTSAHNRFPLSQQVKKEEEIKEQKYKFFKNFEKVRQLILSKISYLDYEDDFSNMMDISSRIKYQASFKSSLSSTLRAPLI